jgi:hypothetical protein
MPMHEYRKRTIHRAGQFAVGMAAADAEALCLEFNAGRDPSKSAVCFYNGSAIFITGPSPTAPLTVNPGNWIVRMPDDSLDVHADADFCSKFCAAS